MVFLLRFESVHFCSWLDCNDAIELVANRFKSVVGVVARSVMSMASAFDAEGLDFVAAVAADGGCSIAVAAVVAAVVVRGGPLSVDLVRGARCWGCTCDRSRRSW